MTSLFDVLAKVQIDILNVLKDAKKPMTQDELFEATKLTGISWYAWPFALDRLEEKKIIQFVSPNKWKLNIKSNK